MAEFISQSEPVQPPSIDVTKPRQKSDPQLYMNNERNVFITVITGCIILLMSVYIPLVLPSDTTRWIGVFLALLALCTLFMGIYTHKRNLDAFEANEQDYLDWNKSSILVYSIGGGLMIISAMVLYDLYWNASKTGKSPVEDILDDVKSVGSMKSVSSSKSGKSD